MNEYDENTIKSQIEEWVKTWQVASSHPSEISVGQIWTIFRPGAPADDRGTMVCVYSVDGEYLYVIPVHTEVDAGTGCEPVLRDDGLPLPASLVAVVEAGVLVQQTALEKARYVGTLGQASITRLGKAFAECREAIQSLTRLQMSEAIHGSDAVPESEIESALEGGVLKLVSPRLSHDELASFHADLLENILPYHNQAVDSLTSETPPVSILEFIKHWIRRIAEVAPPLPTLQLSHAMGPGDGIPLPKDLPNPIEMEIRIPQEPKEVQILPALSEAESALKLEDALWYIMGNFRKYFFAVLAIGDSGILEKWEAKPLPIPEVFEISTNLEAISIAVGPEAKTLIVGIGPEKEALDSALEKLVNEEEGLEPKSPVLWVEYTIRRIGE